MARPQRDPSLDRLREAVTPARPRHAGALRMGTLWLLVTRSLRRHALSTLITVGSAALASGLVLALVAVHDATRRAYSGGRFAYDAVLGARGSQEQLVLNTLFHLDVSPGNLPWELYRRMAEDPRIERAVPYAVGDNYKGYRIVGTTLDVFTGREFVAPGQPFDPNLRQAVVGATVARATGLTRGSTFNPSHGLTYDPKDPKVHAERYVVTGVLEPTGSPDDRVIYIPIEGVYRMGGHELRGSGTARKAEEFAQLEIPDEHKEVSAVLLRFTRKGFTPAPRLRYEINMDGREATLAWPIAEVLAGLHLKLFWAIDVLGIVAGLVVLVTAGSLLASLYNTMNERRHELAVLRALGARRRTVVTAIVAEAAFVALLGAALGFLVEVAILWRIRELLLASSGVLLEHGAGPAHVWVPLGMLGVGALAGLLPAWKAYTTDVCRTLAQGN